MQRSARKVVVEVPQTGVEEGDVVLAAALTLFGPAVEVVLCMTGVEDPGEEDAAALLAVCTRSAASGATMPAIDLLGHGAAMIEAALLHVRAGQQPFGAARDVLRLGAVAASLRDSSGRATGRPVAPAPRTPAFREQLEQRIRARDVMRRDAGASDTLVVAVVQVQSCWSALASICEALRSSPGVIVEVVALESEHEIRVRSTVDFVRSLGIEPRDVDWFDGQLRDQSGPLSLVLLDNPYDGLRPEPLRSQAIAAAGVRIAYSPYGNNVGAGEEITGMQYDLPLHRTAWRAYARSEVQRGMYATHCAAGADHVRLLGMPKLDRIVDAARSSDVDARIRTAARGRPVVLYNPHFSGGPSGWSTLDRYLDPLLGWAKAHHDVVLLLRPHFRIFRDLRLASGGRTHPLEARVRRAVRDQDNILLDESEDYLPSFVGSDAMVSDLSSLITEYLPLRKPTLYLHKEDGPGVNEDAQYFFRLDVATQWDHVEAFLDQVRRRADGGAGRRERLLADHYGDMDGRAGERIAADLISSLQAERAALPASDMVGAP